MQDHKDQAPDESAGPEGAHEHVPSPSRKEQLKAARQRAYQAAKLRAAERRKAAAQSPEAILRQKAQRERAREQRKLAYAQAKAKMAAERRAAKEAARAHKNEERKRKDDDLMASLRRGHEVEPLLEKPTPPTDEKPVRRLRLVRNEEN